MSVNIVSRKTLYIVVVAALLGLAGGAAVAESVLAPAGVATREGGKPTPGMAPTYQTNAAGQTYGVLSAAVLPKDGPDLILVQAMEGKEGYVLKKTLDEVTGANVSSPAEAVAWQQRQDAASWVNTSIPVFESDGVTRIGSFEVSRSVLNYKGSAEQATP